MPGAASDVVSWGDHEATASLLVRGAEEVARMCEWLTEKLDSFSSKLKPEAKGLLEVGGCVMVV